MRTRALCLASAAGVLLLTIFPVASGAHRAHTVQPGESLWSISAANGIGAERLAADNGLAPEAQLLVGSTVMVPEPLVSEPAPVPAPPPVAPAPVPDPVPASPEGGQCVWECHSPEHPHPTNEAVTPAQVGSVAAEHGLSPSLVQAISSVESGNSNWLVSGADARGVMQIIPETWTFVEQGLPGAPLSTTSALSNVEAGARYLHHLYHVNGGDPDATVGSYYQGPNRESLLPETRDYINIVRARQAGLSGG